MARPRTPIGTFGDISYVKAAGGQLRARTRYRDDDGKVRRVSATGSTKREAERNLKTVVAGRSSSRSSGELTADSSFTRLVEVMLGTSARIGEVLAIRRCDVDVTTSPATVRLCGTIVSPAGKPTHRQSHPKTMKSTRSVSVPSFTAEALRARLVNIATEDPEHLIFFSRNGTPLTTNNIRWRLRAVLDEGGIVGVTPHSFRRTVATVIDRASGVALAAELLGHTSSKITKEHTSSPTRRSIRSRPRSWNPSRRGDRRVSRERREARPAYPLQYRRESVCSWCVGGRRRADRGLVA